MRLLKAVVSDTQIRWLDEQDLESVWRLRLESLEREPFAFGLSIKEAAAMGSEALAGRLRGRDEDNFILGAFTGQTIVGMVGFGRFVEEKRRHKGQVWGLYVQQNYRGSGIGRALMVELLRITASQNEVEQLNLIVGTSQVRAKQLYARLGFGVYGHQRKAMKIGELYVDVDMMQLDLR